MTTWWSLQTPEQEADARARREDESRWRSLELRASPEAQRWCQHFLTGGAASAAPTLDERAGWLLAAQAPGRLRTRPDPSPFDDTTGA